MAKHGGRGRARRLEKYPDIEQLIAKLRAAGRLYAWALKATDAAAAAVVRDKGQAIEREVDAAFERMGKDREGHRGLVVEREMRDIVPRGTSGEGGGR